MEIIDFDNLIITGCGDIKYREYNKQVNRHVQDSCKTFTVPIDPIEPNENKSKDPQFVTLNPFPHLSIDFIKSGNYWVNLFDVHGIRVFSRSNMNQTHMAIAELNSGIYWVKIVGEGLSKTQLVWVY